MYHLYCRLFHHLSITFKEQFVQYGNSFGLMLHQKRLCNLWYSYIHWILFKHAEQLSHSPFYLMNSIIFYLLLYFFAFVEAAVWYKSLSWEVCEGGKFAKIQDFSVGLI